MKILRRAAAVLALATLGASVVSAAPQDKGKKAAEAPTCPVCKMALVAKKDKTHTTAVKIGKKTYYCCDKCPMKKGSEKKGKM